MLVFKSDSIVYSTVYPPANYASMVTMLSHYAYYRRICQVRSLNYHYLIYFYWVIIKKNIIFDQISNRNIEILNFKTTLLFIIIKNGHSPHFFINFVENKEPLKLENTETDNIEKCAKEVTKS